MDTLLVVENVANTGLISFFAVLLVLIVAFGFVSKQIKYETMCFVCPKCRTKRYSYAAFKDHLKDCTINI